MFNYLTRSTAAGLVGAALALTATQVQALSPDFTAKLTHFATTAEDTATRSAKIPGTTTSAPPVANGTPAAGTAAAQASPDTPATEHDPEKVGIGAEIMDNFQLVDIAVYGAKIGVAQNADFQKLPEASRQRLLTLIEEEIRARKDIIAREMAEANVDRFTVEQLKVILTLSQIKFIQGLVLHGAGIVPMPDPSTMTPAEQATVEADGNMPFVLDFMQNIDMTPLGNETLIAMQNAFARFSAPSTPTT